MKRLFSLLFLLTLLLSSCDLFNNPADPDFLNKLYAEIAWANAERLTVTVVTRGMGFSPQSVSTGDTRKGYQFNVEFTPNVGFGFRGWLAFTNSKYEEILPVLNSMSFETARDTHSLNSKGVVVAPYEITHTGSYLSSVKIDIMEAVTLVPWCSTLPALSQATNPPLIQIQGSFPKNQTVRLVFTMDIDPSTVILGESISIRGVYIDGDKKGTQAGDEGDITNYFKIEFPSAGRVNLIPLDDDPDFDWSFLGITVFVGPEIKNTSGLSMSSQEIISYQTDAGEAQKAYTTSSIQASWLDKDQLGNDIYFQNNGTVWNNPSIDRRFNTRDRNTAHLRFQVFQPDEVTILPNRFYIVEQMYANLGGLGGSANSASMPPFHVPAGKITRDGVNYQIEYDLQLRQSGIIRLIVLPCYYDSENAENNIPPLNASDAVAIGQYVTVVMDLDAPYLGNPGAVISGHTSVSTLHDQSTVFVFGASPVLNLTLNNLHLLRDNTEGIQGGISAADAFNRPWTMDDPAHLQWQVIAQGTGADNVPLKRESAWRYVYQGAVLNNTFSADIKTDTNNFKLTNGVVYTLSVIFMDRMGNDSVPVEIGKIQSIEGEASAATLLKGICNSAGNQITVSFAPPAVYSSLELTVRRYQTTTDGDVYENINRYTLNSTDNITEHTDSYNKFQRFTEDSVSKLRYSFTSPQINEDVRNGTGVSNVYGYEVTVITHAAAGTAVTPAVWVYNIPNMDGDATNTARITTNAITSADLAKTNIVLTRNIILESHTPINLTNRRFYGNGHSITIKSFAASLTSDIGLFGVVGQDSEIRDLTVVYAGEDNAVDVTLTGEVNFGGLAGTAEGNAKFINVLVKGAVEISGDNTNFIGGIVGQLTGTISDAYGGLNLTVHNDGTGISLYVGGITGTIGWETIAKVERTSAVGNITVGGSNQRINSYTTNNRTEGLFVGGLAGIIRGLNNSNQAVLHDSDYRQGAITVWSGTGVAIIGGALGRNWNSEITDSSSIAGSFNIDKNDGVSQFYVGGFIGDFYSTGTIRNCHSENNIVLNTANTYTGNAVGGGFAGRIGGGGTEVIVSHCYAKGNVSVLGFDYIYGGGFAGIIDTGEVIEFCYATGNIRAIHRGTFGEVFAGGFAGESRSLSNCYALGEVFVFISSIYPIYAGSLVGVSRDLSPTGSAGPAATIERSFARGDVIVQRTINGTTQVGGLVGFHTGANTIRNSVSLARSITVMGIPAPANAAARTFSRILGEPNASTAPTLTNNYAYIDMKLYHKTNINTIGTTDITSQVVSSANGKDGANTHLGTFRSRPFWSGLGFHIDNWNFSTVEDRGYPILKTADGGIMGGQ